MDIGHLIRSQGVELEVSKIKVGKVIWINDNRSDTWDKSGFIERYAYASSDSKCFSKCSFVSGTRSTMIAEPYGGRGVGANGGGGRCGNTGDVQIKGVGANPLVGDHDNEEHSYGGLDIRKATIETVYSEVLSELLPKGVVNVRGLIYIGHDTARAGKQKVWGGLMVRDHCIRPGHFMRSPYFKPRDEVKELVKDDLSRIRWLYKEMHRGFKGDCSSFIKWIGQYLRDTANQLAFARVMRVTHGTMTASNISWDGKWLDLPACSFLTGGVNYSIWSQFYEEHHMALSYALEILHCYSKYNRVALNPNPLISYFYEQFEEYGRYYVGYALGINLNDVLDLPKNSWKNVSETFLRVVHSGTRIEPKRPSYDPNDPVISLTVAFFMACSGSDAFLRYAKKAGLEEAEAINFKQSSVEVFSALLEIDGSAKGGIKSFFIRTALSAMKRALLPEMWYLPVVEGQVTTICSEGTPDEIGPFIDKHKETAQWVFEDLGEKVTLYSGKGQSAYYSVDDAMYYLVDDFGANCFYTFSELNSHILRYDILSNPGIYDFTKFFDRLEDFLDKVGETYVEKNSEEGFYV